MSSSRCHCEGVGLVPPPIPIPRRSRAAVFLLDDLISLYLLIISPSQYFGQGFTPTPPPAPLWGGFEVVNCVLLGTSSMKSSEIKCERLESTEISKSCSSHTQPSEGRAQTGPYQCSQCGKRFAKKTDLGQHQRIHTGENPYQCSQCGMRFTQRGNLHQHQRIHTGEKLYCCSQCGWSFTTHSSFQQHQRVHMGEKPYRCSQCEMRFTNQSNLRRHQRVHTGQKTHRCSECEKSFSNQSNLQRHKHLHRASPKR